MSNRRITPATLHEELNEVYRRLDQLTELTGAGRVLPPGYQWTVGPDDELTVVRTDDHSSNTLIG